MIDSTEVADQNIVLTLYVHADGTLYGWFETPPEDGYPVEGYNEFYDQIWLFPGWSESPSQNRLRETNWRTAEMEFIANNLLYLEDENDLATPPLVAKTWRNYRIKVMAWQEGAPNFPYITYRPIRPA